MWSAKGTPHMLYLDKIEGSTGKHRYDMMSEAHHVISMCPCILNV